MVGAPASVQTHSVLEEAKLCFDIHSLCKYDQRVSIYQLHSRGKFMHTSEHQGSKASQFFSFIYNPLKILRFFWESAKSDKIMVTPLRGMYFVTLIGVVPLGLIMMTSPETLDRFFGWKVTDPVFAGAYGACLLAMGILCALALRSPTKFMTVLFYQFCYKLSWFIFVWFPLTLSGEYPDGLWLYTSVMFAAILVDIVVVPFPYIFKKVPVPVELQK
jgi:hypothetical protein